MRESWESLIRDFVRHLKGTNRALSTQTIYRRAAAGLVDHLEQEGSLPAPRQASLSAALCTVDSPAGCGANGAITLVRRGQGR
jgi:hypothetical protein